MQWCCCRCMQGVCAPRLHDSCCHAVVCMCCCTDPNALHHTGNLYSCLSIHDHIAGDGWPVKPETTNVSKLEPSMQHAIQGCCACLAVNPNHQSNTQLLATPGQIPTCGNATWDLGMMLTTALAPSSSPVCRTKFTNSASMAGSVNALAPWMLAAGCGQSGVFGLSPGTAMHRSAHMCQEFLASGQE